MRRASNMRAKQQLRQVRRQATISRQVKTQVRMQVKYAGGRLDALLR